MVLCAGMLCLCAVCAVGGTGGSTGSWVETSALFVGLGQPGVWGMREARVTGDLDECMMRAALLPDWAAGCEILSMGKGLKTE